MKGPGRTVLQTPSTSAKLWSMFRFRSLPVLPLLVALALPRASAGAQEVATGGAQDVAVRPAPLVTSDAGGGERPFGVRRSPAQAAGVLARMASI